MLLNGHRDQVPLLTIWLSIEEEIPMSDKVKLLRDVGRKIPGGNRLVTILNTVTNKQIEEKLAVYDLETQNFKRKNYQHNEVQTLEKYKVEKQQSVRTNYTKPYNTRFQARQVEKDKFRPITRNQEPMPWQRNVNNASKFRSEQKGNVSNCKNSG